MSDQAEAAAEWRADQSCQGSCKTIVRSLQAGRRRTLVTSHHQQYMPLDRHHQQTLDKQDHSTTFMQSH